MTWLWCVWGVWCCFSKLLVRCIYNPFRPPTSIVLENYRTTKKPPHTPHTVGSPKLESSTSPARGKEHARRCRKAGPEPSAIAVSRRAPIFGSATGREGLEHGGMLFGIARRTSQAARAMFEYWGCGLRGDSAAGRASSAPAE